MKNKTKLILLVGSFCVVAYVFRYPIAGEVITWNDDFSYKIASNTKNEDLLYALITSGSKNNAPSQYRLLDKCYVSLSKIYNARDAFFLDENRIKLLNRAFGCYEVMSHNVEDFHEVRKIHRNLIDKLKSDPRLIEAKEE